jgi:hypothetical protein
LVTNGIGLPVLQLGPAGNVVEWSDRVPAVAVGKIASLEVLASSVASWILFNADDPGEFRFDDIHPTIRERVRELVPDCIGNC